MLLTVSVLLQIGVILTKSQICLSDDDLLSCTLLNSQNYANLTAECLITRSLLKTTLDVNKAGQIANQRPVSNFAFGPVTITGVLALLLLGSVGRTFDEIANFMGFNHGFNIENDNIQVHNRLEQIMKKIVTTAKGATDGVSYQTAIFLQEDFPIRPEYKQAAKYFYRSDIVNLDFYSDPATAYHYINNFAKNSTHGKITSVLDDIPDNSTKAIIVGIMYFKEAWEQPFMQRVTRLTQFYVNGKSNPSDRNVTMMFNGGNFPYYMDKQLDVQVLGLPYKGRRTTMYVLVPNDSNLKKLKELENRLTPHDIQRLVNSTSTTEVIVGFPKMKIENTVDLKVIMESLGVQTMFNQYEANFALLSPCVKKKPGKFHGDCANMYNHSSRCRRKRDVPKNYLDTLRTEYRKHKSQISKDNPEIFANKFVHKIFMDINEVGTEAAATSTVSMSRSEKITVKCDVPFLFFIYHEHAKVILFWASIKSPSY